MTDLTPYAILTVILLMVYTALWVDYIRRFR